MTKITNLLSRWGVNDRVSLQNNGGKQLLEHKVKERPPLLADNETSENAFDEQKTKEVFMLVRLVYVWKCTKPMPAEAVIYGVQAQKGSVSASIRKQSLCFELEQDQKEKERLQKKSEELDVKYQKKKAELDKILKEKDELKKNLKMVDARANKRKALDTQLDSQIIKIRAIASTAGALMSDLKRHLQIISAPE